jgi:Ca2+-binding EF-hand superfamily protein
MNCYSLRNHRLAITVGSLLLAFGASANDDKMRMDTNKDGMVSASEYDAGVRSSWSKMDPENDGRINSSDVESRHRAMDADKDGTITSAEYESGSRSMFSKWDTDGDGSLSSAEMQAGVKQTTDQPH